MSTDGIWIGVAISAHLVIVTNRPGHATSVTIGRIYALCACLAA